MTAALWLRVRSQSRWIAIILTTRNLRIPTTQTQDLIICRLQKQLRYVNCLLKLGGDLPGHRSKGDASYLILAALSNRPRNNSRGLAWTAEETASSSSRQTRVLLRIPSAPIEGGTDISALVLAADWPDWFPTWLEADTWSGVNAIILSTSYWMVTTFFRRPRTAIQ